jgi:hemerythrin-like domain-containing protein
MDRKPTDVMEDEHRVIRRAVDLMAVLARHLGAGRLVEADTLRDIVHFLRGYADRYHHGKEETHLFTLLEARGVPTQGCPLGALMAEHQEGRALVNELAQAIEAYAPAIPSTREPLVQSLHTLAELYPNHIWKEDYLLFPMTNKVLSPEDQASLYERFEAVDDALGRDVHLQFEQLVRRLEKGVHGS